MSHKIKIVIDDVSSANGSALSAKIESQIEDLSGKLKLTIINVGALSEVSKTELFDEIVASGVAIYIPIVNDGFLRSPDAYLRYMFFQEIKKQFIFSENTFPIVEADSLDYSKISRKGLMWLESFNSLDVWSRHTGEMRNNKWLMCIQRSLRPELGESIIIRWVRATTEKYIKKENSRKWWGWQGKNKSKAAGVLMDPPSSNRLEINYKKLSLTQQSIIRYIYLYIQSDKISLDNLYEKYLAAYGSDSIRGASEFYYRIRSLAAEGYIDIDMAYEKATFVSKLEASHVEMHPILRWLPS